MEPIRDLFDDYPAHMPKPTKRGLGGHAGIPGLGPKTETCGSCAYLFRHITPGRRVFFKCGKIQWTFGPGTDIRLRDPACSQWQQK